MMTHHTSERIRGQSLMEVVFALAVFTVGVVTVGYLLFDAFVSLERTNDYTDARFLAREGIETLQSVGRTHFAELAPGAYGFTYTAGEWALTPEPSTHGIYTRTVTIEDTDSDRKTIEVEIAWEDAGSVTRAVRARTAITNWSQLGGDREMLTPRIEYATLSASGTALTGVEVSNDSDESITITDMIVAWDGAAELTNVIIDGTEVFSATVTPATSGSLLDITDFTLNPYSGFRTIDSIAFTDSIVGTDVHITFVLGDTSRRYLLVTP